MLDLIKNLKLQFNPVYKVPFLWIKNRDLRYRIMDLKETLDYKTSDTIFILGSGPSLNMLHDKHLEEIQQHNSLSINYTFLFDKIIPTFHFQENGWDSWRRNYLQRILAKHRKRLSGVVWLLSSRETARGLHPRLTPSFFPENPVCWSFQYPSPIFLEKNRPFCDEDFQKSLIYRGSLTVVLDRILKLGYKNIVLLGVDPDKPTHFYEKMEEMQEYSRYIKETFEKSSYTQYINMHPQGNKYHPIDVYLYALKDYLRRKHGINLLVGFKDNMLYPELPAYFD